MNSELLDKILVRVTANIITLGIVTAILCATRLNVSRELFMNGRAVTTYSVKLAL